ncbi:11159_t:CDS:1, partial [Funneliformis geosporum]
IYDLYQEMSIKSDKLEIAITTTCEEEVNDDDLQLRQISENIPKIEYNYGKLDLLI